jgi:hypothetical protein
VIWLGKSRKPWITHEMISKMDERWKWKNVYTEDGRKNYRRLRNELKRATGNAKKEYLENICNKIMEFQRTGNWMYMTTEDKRTRLEGDPRNLKYWHQRLPREQKSRAKSSAENSGELYYRTIQST